jgi:hypothetical protein
MCHPGHDVQAKSKLMEIDFSVFFTVYVVTSLFS